MKGQTAWRVHRLRGGDWVFFCRQGTLVRDEYSRKENNKASSNVFLLFSYPANTLAA